MLPEKVIKDMTLKQEPFGKLVSSKCKRKLGSIVSLLWMALLLRHFEEGMKATSKVLALIAVPFARNKLQLSFI